MKGHNYGLCRKCGKMHVPPMLNPSDATREKLREASLGNKNPMKRPEVVAKITGEKNVNWKGDDVGYDPLHKWVEKHKPKPLLCEICGKKKKLELANISGEYRRDINDFKWVCRKCNSNMGIAKHSRFKKTTMEK